MVIVLKKLGGMVNTGNNYSGNRASSLEGILITQEMCFGKYSNLG